jgi:hypothetical protein
MEAIALKLICSSSKAGDSLSQISELTGLTQDQVKEILGQATGLAPADLSMIFHMKQRGLSLDQISQRSFVELQVLEQFLPQEAPAVIKESVMGFEAQIEALSSQGLRPPEIGRALGINERAVLAYTLGSPYEGVSLTSKAPEPAPVYDRTPSTEEAKQPQRPQPTQTKPQHTPTFFYSCQGDTNQLHRVNLLTGEQSKHEVPHYQFKRWCRWSELPGGNLLITGGQYEYKDVVKIDTLREYAVSSQPPMHTARYSHAAVYHSQYVYVLGGLKGLKALGRCERYVCAESRWEKLAALPVAGESMSAVELHNSLYALGGRQADYLDTVQQLSLDSLTWQLMQLKLPQADYYFPCFKKDTEVYLVIKETLYSFTPLEVKPIKTIPEDCGCYSSYYSRGTLYYECGRGIGLTRL